MGAHSDVEVLYRDQRDYQSKYRTVVEYFDAVKIALTATPALHTTEIFGQPIFKYTYREAVIEGYLVDHDAPHHLETKLSTGGIHYKSGDTVTVSVTMNVYTHIGFDDAEEELKRMEEFRKVQAEVEQKKEKPMSQKMFKVV